MEQQEVRYLACQTAQTSRVFSDDIETSCALCGAAIYHRPHALADVPGAVAVCITCALVDAAEHKARGGTTSFGVTARTLREAADYLRREAGGAGQKEDAGG